MAFIKETVGSFRTYLLLAGTFGGLFHLSVLCEPEEVFTSRVIGLIGTVLCALLLSLGILLPMALRTQFGVVSAVLRGLNGFSLAASLAIVLTGCGNGSTVPPPSPPKTAPRAEIPAVPPLPPEYLILAKYFTEDFKAHPDEFRDHVSDAESTEQIQECLSALSNLKSDDVEMTNFVNRGTSLARELQVILERMEASGNKAGETSWWDLVTRTVQLKEVIQYLEQLDAVWRKLDGMQAELPQIAQKYSATPSAFDGRFLVDLDASWGPCPPFDWFKIFNSGPDDLENCTVQVQLTGDQENSRTNVHFVRHWPAHSWRYARYRQGGGIPGHPDLFRTTVSEPRTVRVSVWSTTYTTTLDYVYQGPEQDKDIAQWCQDLRFEGRYQPFVSGILWNTERGVVFSLAGMDSLPRFRAEMNFRKGLNSKTWSWNRESWTRGEAITFTPPSGALTFDPTQIDMTISFPNTSYQHKTTLQVK
ncbi:MAG TPA: hypothetical protein VNQ76_14530 [Planctomicrobium sp.]|nr:hypothetical protein [Planctomicrobium sp.]